MKKECSKYTEQNNHLTSHVQMHMPYTVLVRSDTHQNQTTLLVDLWAVQQLSNVTHFQRSV